MIKKLAEITALVLLLLAIWGCAKEEETTGKIENSNGVTESSLGITPDSENVPDTENAVSSENTDNNDVESSYCENTEESDKNITITVAEKSDKYYAQIIGSRYKSENIVFGDKKGTYFNIISTSTELQQILSAPNVDSSIFEDNYVICISSSECVGYYEFKYENGEYSISVDTYSQYKYKLFPGIEEPIIEWETQRVDFIIVPKDEVEYVDNYQEITINQVKRHQEGAFFLDFDQTATLPDDAQFWVATVDSPVVKQYGLEKGFENKSHKYIIAYFPSTFENDFVVSGCEIKNGDLYLTVESYLQKSNFTMKKGNVKFYAIYNECANRLPEHFNTYITVNEIHAPAVPTLSQIVNPNITIADAINIAQVHFFNSYAEELLPRYYYTAKSVCGDNDNSWYVCVFEKSTNKSENGSFLENYLYEIDKRTGEILQISRINDILITEGLALIIATEYYTENFAPPSQEDISMAIVYPLQDKWLVVICDETYYVSTITGEISIAP